MAKKIKEKRITNNWQKNKEQGIMAKKKEKNIHAVSMVSFHLAFSKSFCQQCI